MLYFYPALTISIGSSLLMLYEITKAKHYTNQIALEGIVCSFLVGFGFPLLIIMAIYNSIKEKFNK